MTRLAWQIVIITAVSLACFILFMLPNPPGAYQAPWNPSVLWAPWAEAIKVLATLVASITGFYYGFYAPILGSVRLPVKMIALGCLFITVGTGTELYMRIQGNDANVLSWASVFFALGAILVVIALFAFPGKLGATMTPKQKSTYSALILALVLGTALIFILLPDTGRMDLEEILTCATYDVFILLIFIASLRLAILFSHGKMGRPFRLIAIGGFLIGVYEYYVWLPIVNSLSIFNPVHILWIAGFLVTAAGIIDCEIQE